VLDNRPVERLRESSGVVNERRGPGHAVVVLLGETCEELVVAALPVAAGEAQRQGHVFARPRQ
jgi:hypothetical protein